MAYIRRQDASRYGNCGSSCAQCHQLCGTAISAFLPHDVGCCCYPSPGQEKHLRVEYSYGGDSKVLTASRPEHSRMVLPQELGDNIATSSAADNVQPDVALVWDWTDEERPYQSLMGRTEKHILIHNRSERHIYNIQIEPI